MIFDYKKEEVFTKSIDVVDIGNFALRCVASYSEYYIVVKTVMGKTAILKFGPTMPDVPVLCDNYALLYKVINFKEPAICKEVNMFINDFKKEIEDIEEITEYEALQNLPEITVDSLIE